MSERRQPNPHGPGRLENPRLAIVHAHAEYIEVTPAVLDHYGQKAGKLGELVHAVDWLERIGLSAHVLVTTDGERIRTRNDDQGAWHAKGCNRNSLGVEILVPDVTEYQSFLERIAHPWASSAQYHVTAEIVAEWMRRSVDVVKRHSDVDPARKHDPGRGFQWEAFLQLVDNKR